MSSIRVLLVDSEQLVLEGFRKLLDGFTEFCVVSITHDAAAALAQLHRHRPQIVVMGLGVAGTGGVDAVRAIRRESGHIRIVILSSNQQPVYMREAFLAGANAYLSRSIDAVELRETLLAVHRDGAAFTAATAGPILQLMSGRGCGDDSPLAMLTERERQILSLVADDHETDCIATHLGIRPKTVRNYLSRIYAKLGTPNRVQTVLYAKRSLGRQGDLAADP
ncbi:response regulator transcription factor [Streptomyces sp. MZ04]|uniref:response regulator transcription factor n=1 Tax=Streptomyces sp. MZ04 TaxID=2559236 RepID=UPI00107E8800|nr:response regulator transcription factor [Streptomyces sp. MZ04]TGB10191.1 response regulator transcription factor [Streptomyces sp. MZ04]